MAYIGKTPVIGNFQKCDSIAVVNGQAAYTLQVGGTNVSPQSENHMLVSLNGILQAPVDSFTVSGSTLTFASNLITGDVIDFVMILGNVLDLGVPSDNTVSLAKLTATGTKDATTFLRGDNTFAEAGGGKLLQVVQGSTSTETRSSSNTLIDTTLSATITPSSSSSQVLVTVFQNGCDKSAANSGNQMVLKLLRGASVITTFGNNVTYTNSAISNAIGTVGTMYLDSPATTSATTYKTQFANANNTANVGVQGTGGETSIITLMEISA